MKRLTALFRFSAIAGMMFFSSLIYGQKTVTPCSGGCDPLTKADDRSISEKSKDGGTVKLYYANGLLKYKETKRGKTVRKTYYAQNGSKCKKESVNTRMDIKKTSFYDVTGKRELACKGSSE